MFPALEPFASGLLGVGKGTEIYWEASGNPKGKPALYLHGGPGSGLKAGYRRQFDPNKFLIVALDQRGCGRSRPLVTDPSYELSTNTTQTMIGDIESLRIHLGVDTWLVNGVSWGTTLALAYAQAHPTRVNSLVLFAVTTTSRGEVDWITEEIGRIFPREWEEYADASGRRPGQRVVDAYAERMADPDGAVRERAAAAWCRWEDVHVSLDPRHVPNPRYNDPAFRLVLTTLVTHVWSNSAFLGDHGILDRMNVIAHIPAVLIHGRLDVSSPLSTAWNLHQNWPNSELVVVEEDGHGSDLMGTEWSKANARFADSMSLGQSDEVKRSPPKLIEFGSNSYQFPSSSGENR